MRTSAGELEIVLAAAGLTLDDLVKTTVFLKDMNNFAKMNEEYGKFFPNNPPHEPQWKWLDCRAM